MRGKLFHNQIAAQAQRIFNHFGWQVATEYRCRKNGIVTYFDLLATKDNHKIACEIETTRRHALDNAVKAQHVGIDLWIIVPSRQLQRHITSQLKSANIPASVMLLAQLEAALTQLSHKSFFYE